uniref:Uncharacterized protein n=1 Tax=Oryza glumipatula TaxID=40148 RepID=A0A0E0BV68_9ORYZ
MESLAHIAGHTPRRRGEAESPPAESGPPVRPFQDEATDMGPVACLSLNRRREEETPPRHRVGEDTGRSSSKALRPQARLSEWHQFMIPKIRTK